ncbi:MAG TPA: ABC transporter ATP-binding protein [Firmicutes bacterium]|nr:ABC transporter ATP-binding protein [Bacillota bacterium]
MLRVQGIDVFYGSIQALKEVSLEVGEGEIVCLIGSNGAGKTTVLRTISGLLKPRKGSIEFMGERIDNKRPSQVVRGGISCVPEGRRIFPGLTVLENLEMGAYVRRRKRTEVSEAMERVFALFPVLKERARQAGGTLSGGQQQMLAIARALMAGPRLLLLDEPSLGLAPFLVEQVFDAIKRINQEEKVTVLLVEQNAKMALEIANRGYVLVNGVVSLHDTASNLKDNEKVRETYLGG